MPKLRIALVISAAAGLLAGSTALAQFGGAEFSAELIQQGPQGQASSGKMYVGKNRIRNEMTQSGQQVIHIVDNNRQTEWLLYPKQRSYMEMGAGEAKGGPPKPSSKDPCAGLPSATCKNLGKEKISGRDTTKWEMTFDFQGKAMKGTQWIDDERGIPLREVRPDGQTSELRLLGPDIIEGRRVEKWEMILGRGDEVPQRSYQWYDPKLELAIKREFPGGYKSELRNIREGKQADILFSIPAGYRQINAPSTDVTPLR